MLMWLGSALMVLVYLFSAFAMADGICAAATGIALSSQTSHWWMALLQGLVGILVGLGTLLWPQITWLALPYFVGFWAVASGISEIALGVERQTAIAGEWMIDGSVLSILLGLLLALFPAAGIFEPRLLCSLAARASSL